MDFSNLLNHFKNTMSKILDLEKPIQEYDIKNVSNILKEFAKFYMNTSEVRMFLDSVLIFFVLLNKYAKQFESIMAQKHFSVRLALEVFLFVVDSTQIYDSIITKFAKVIDTILESDPLNSNVKEYFRIYSHILDEVSSDIFEKLSAKHKKFYIWYDVVKNTGDIETQAIIINVLFKLFKFHDLNVILEKFFPEIMQVLIPSITSTDEKSIYQNIRMVLDKINESGTNIFSINCSSIALDLTPVEEFSMAAATDNIWLDFNLLEEKISFFCSKSFFTSVTKIKPFLKTSWEVLSFCPRDVLKVDFNHNLNAKCLDISIKLKNSVFNVSCSPKFDTVRNLEISVSQCSESFKILVEKVLPEIFPNTFSIDCLKFPSEEDNDSSVTADISLQSANSSAVLNCFIINRPKISTREKAEQKFLDSQIVHTDPELENFILISDDEDDNTINKTDKNKNRIYAPIDDKEATRDNLKKKKHKNGMVKTRKTRVGDPIIERIDSVIQFNKSVTPVSFSESVVGKPKKKISRRDSPKQKIPSLKKKKGHKVSSSLTSPIVKIVEKPVVSKKRKGKEKDLIEIVREANELEEVLETSQSCSVSKVEDWLKSVNVDPVLTEKKNLEIPIFKEKIVIDPDSVLPISSAISDVSEKTGEVDMEMVVEEQTPKMVEENKEDNTLEKSECFDVNSEVQEEISAAEINNNYLDENNQKSPEEISRNDETEILEEEKEVEVSKISAEVEEDISKIFVDDKNNELEVQAENKQSKIHTDELLSILSSQIEKTPEVVDKISDRNDEIHIQDEVEENISKIFSEDRDNEVEIQVENKEREIHTRDLSRFLSSQKEKTPEFVDKASDRNNEIHIQDEVEENISKIFSENRDNEVEIQTGNKEREIPTRDLLRQKLEDQDSDSSTSSGVILKDSIFDKMKNLEPKKEIKSSNNVEKSPPKYNISSDSDNEGSIMEEERRQNNQNVDIKEDLNVKSITKRKLYSPGDLSYLKAQMTDEYLTAKPEVKLLPGLKRTRSRSRKSKTVKTKRGRPAKVTSTPKALTKEDLTKTEIILEENSKRLESFRETLREVKKNKKYIKKSKKNKKAVPMGSSSESMEPFGDAVKKCQKRKSVFLTDTNTKRYKDDNPNELSVEEIKIDKKIHIISNVLIQPANSQNLHSNVDILDCYERLVKSNIENFLECIENVQKCEPRLLENEKCKKIFNILRSVHEPN
ncbi:centromere-associated protein E-like [Tribolium madens]|uniref:centromere-associated protein E-like n=1 Tax=Tribolium madens TaxID=41895 RepID=UPI001CF7608F|nr:centromere-associated protein E-like [Tribolium madens]